MLKRMLLPLVGAAVCLAFAVSCGPSFRHIQVRSMTEAEYLKAEVAAKNLRGDDVAAADGFLARAQESKKPREAADLADAAAAYYRLALARQTLAASSEDLTRAEAALRESAEQVNRYQRVLASVESNAGGGE